MVGAVLPGTWLMFSLCYSRGNYVEFLRKWRGVLVMAYAVPVLAVGAFWEGLIWEGAYSEAGFGLFIGGGLGGRIVYFTLFAAGVFIFFNFEGGFRSAVGVVKWG